MGIRMWRPKICSEEIDVAISDWLFAGSKSERLCLIMVLGNTDV